jgi:prepilin-type N-terminal cleavage/methylation domain-containing protein/prepilin-type processing-associated H-X9-DG protein
MRRAFTLIEAIIVIAIVGALVSLLIPVIQRVRSAAEQLQCKANLRQIGLALTQYSGRGHYPPATQSWGKPQAFLSWQARILPYLEQSALWSQTQAAFRSEPLFWKGPHIPIRSTILESYLCPSDHERLGTFGKKQPPAAFTHYIAVSGDRTGAFNGVMYTDSNVKPRDITDGLSNTVIVGERPASANGRFGWWYAGIGQLGDGCLDSHMAIRQINQTFYAPMCPIGPYSFGPGRQDEMCSVFHFWSLHSGGAHFLFADNSVRFLSYSADRILPALATRSGKEPNEHLDE